MDEKYLFLEKTMTTKDQVGEPDDDKKTKTNKSEEDKAVVATTTMMIKTIFRKIYSSSSQTPILCLRSSTLL